MHLQGDLRIAHCGGFHSNLDRLITAFNVLAKLLHHNIRWDSETIGCEPSLSSIPAAEQRTLLTAMQELANWLAMPQNEKEFLIVFFDDQMDLASWVSLDGMYLLPMFKLCSGGDLLSSIPTLMAMLAPWNHVPLLAPSKYYM